jgi:acyl carrier protein
MDPLSSRVVCVIAASMSLLDEEVFLTDHLVHDLKIDSLDYVELVMALEREFAIVVDDAAATRLETVEGVIDYVRHQLVNGAARAA